LDEIPEVVRAAPNCEKCGRGDKGREWQHQTVKSVGEDTRGESDKWPERLYL